jgi:hypothetical protein
VEKNFKDEIEENEIFFFSRFNFNEKKVSNFNFFFNARQTKKAFTKDQRLLTGQNVG